MLRRLVLTGVLVGAGCAADGGGGPGDGAEDGPECLLVRSEVDHGDDGVLEQIDAFAYDSAGRQVELARDEGADGTVDARYLSSWTAEGLPLTSETDEDADGVVDSRTTYHHDARDRLVLVEWDPEADGVPYSCVHTAWTDDDLVAEVVVDVGCDGTAEVRQTYDWYDDGSPAGVSTDSDGDGVVDDRVSYPWVPPPEVSWSEDGLVETEGWDHDGDGEVDRILVRTHDAEGRVISVEIDDGADGDLDERIAWTWAADGSHEVVREVDLVGDQSFIWSRVCRYSAEGWLIFEEEVFDLSAHGGGAQVSTDTWTRDEGGRVLSWLATDDYEDDGIYEEISRTSNTWECAG